MVSGYYYNDEVAAQAAVDAVNAYYGCPMEGVDTWTTYQAWGNGWAIMADDSLEVVLGEAVELPLIADYHGGYYRRSNTLDENGLYTIEHEPNPVLADGTVLTSENYEQYDGAEGWHWYAAGQPVDLKVTPTRWESVKNWFSRLF